MAKMFYSAEEVAERLGVDPSQLDELVNQNKLQPFQDRGKVMYKRDQVEQLAEELGGGGEEPSSGEDQSSGGEEPAVTPDETAVGSGDQGDTDAIALAEETDDQAQSPTEEPTEAPGLAGEGEESGAGGEAEATRDAAETSPSSGDTDAIELLDDAEEQPSTGGDAPTLSEPGEATGGETGEQTGDSGVNVLEADEVGAADTSAQTQVGTDESAGTGEDDATLESVGSGSGLLDLTRESDDTSLGAVELLEESEGEGEAQPQAATAESTEEEGAATGVFEAPEQEGETAQWQAQGTEASGVAPAAPAATPQAEPYDPTGDGLGGGVLVGSLLILVVATLVVITGMQGMIIRLTEMMAKSTNTLLMYAGGFLVACIVFGVAGYLIGSVQRR